MHWSQGVSHMRRYHLSNNKREILSIYDLLSVSLVSEAELKLHQCLSLYSDNRLLNVERRMLDSPRWP